MRSLARRPALAVLLALSAGACRKPRPETPTGPAALPPLEVVTGAEAGNVAGKDAGKATRWLFTYADAEGRFVTTDDPKAVPPGSRRIVRVTDPARAGERREGVSVYVVDLDALVSQGRATARVLSREAFESGALAQLPPGESSAFPGALPGAPAMPPEPDKAATGPAPDGGPVVVTLYGTSWCQACKAARQYLREHNVPFADKDIERDAGAARELRAKAARLGVPADRVPILDVRGRLLIGFDKARLAAALGEAS